MTAALFLARAGYDVQIFDQFERPKPIGSGLLIQPSGQVVLSQLGLLDQISAYAAPVTELYGLDVKNSKRALDMQYRNLGRQVHALGIHRASLFNVLFAAVRNEGIAVQGDSKLDHVVVAHDSVVPIFLKGRHDTDFDLLIDATGANGPLATGHIHTLPFAAFWTTVDRPPKIRLAASSLDQRYYQAEKMAGIMPVGINPATGNQGAALFWSIKLEDAASAVEAGIDKWRAQFNSLWPEAAPFVDQVQSFNDLTLAVYRHRTGVASTNLRIFHVGDAWHCTSPQLGQGANMALVDALALARAVEQADCWQSLASHYHHYRADHVQLYQLLSYFFTPLYQSESVLLPAARDAIIHNLAKLPLVRNLIANVVSGNLGNTTIW